MKNQKDVWKSSSEKSLEAKSSSNKHSDMLYLLEESPPWYKCIIFALQHCFLAISGSIGAPMLIASHLCIFNDDVGDRAKATLVGTVLVCNGIATLIQTTVGSRLPIMQGSSFSFFIPSVAILSLSQHKCPAPLTSSNLTNGTDGGVWYNDTDGVVVDGETLWQRRITEIQGAVIVASCFEMVLAVTGLVGIMTKYLGPMTVAPTITLIGLDLVPVVPVHAHYHWGIAFTTAAVLIITSQFLNRVQVPYPKLSAGRGLHHGKVHFFQLFPVILAMLCGWFICWILTITNVLPNNPDDPAFYARTDSKTHVVAQSPWFRIPYPGQWGAPQFAVSGLLAMCAGALASIIESIGDYSACAKLSGAPFPPPHAINRGIAMEGFGTMLAGVFGTATGMTSYSENIAALGVTRVASRRVLQVSGAIYIVLGCFAKAGSVLVTIPAPVFGGMFMVVFGLVIAVGISNLQHVDMNSQRNIFIIGFSLLFGLLMPHCIRTGSIVINSGVDQLDQTILVLLSSSMFVGGFLAMFLDNTLPGTDNERGITAWNSHDREGSQTSTDSYDLPFPSTCRCARYIPILPGYDQKLGTKEDAQFQDENEHLADTII